MRTLTRGSLLALLALTATPLFAHDFWIEPGSFHPAVGALLTVHLRVGDHGRGDEVERRAKRILRFTAVDNSGARDVVGRDGEAPAGLLRLESSGLLTLGYETNTAALELPPERFESYLREEGLESVLAERSARGETKLPGREHYSRCAKSLVRVDGTGAGPGPVLGLPLEFVLLADPFAVAEGPRVLELELRFEGRPLAGATVGLLSLDVAPHEHGDGDHVHPQEHRARSDAAGRVRLEVPAAGRWMVASVHMQRAAQNSSADWRSWWSSLTLELP